MSLYMVIRHWEEFPQCPPDSAWQYIVKRGDDETMGEFNDYDSALDLILELRKAE